MIEIRDLKKVFNSGKPNEIYALNGINLQINKSDFLVLVGANGSGKTTLLNAISGNSIPSFGEILIDSKIVTNLPEHKRSKWIARVFQNPLSGTAPDLSILDNFRLAALRTQPKNLHIGVTEAFKKSVQDKIASLGMGLENKVKQPMGTLSGGQRQALTLLMCIMDDLKILLLDEPTAALDPRSAELVMQTASQLIHDYHLTAILVTHSIKDAYHYGNRIIQMEEGTVIRDINASVKSDLKQTDIYEWFL